MIYIQLDVNFRDHQRVMEACEDIEDRTARAEKRFAIYGLFAAGLSYCQEKCLKG